MVNASDAPPITPSSPMKDGEKRAPWASVRASTASKPCAHCGNPVRPYQWDKWPYWETETGFAKRRFCGKSCAKKSKNPMMLEGARERMAATLKRIGHGPTQRGGNGQPMPEAQAKLLECLGADWQPEHIVRTKLKPTDGFPYHYKIDLANPVLKVAVEIDGGSHGSLVRQEQDRKKEDFLRQSGWKLLRLKNSEALSLSTTCASTATRHILQAAS